MLAALDALSDKRFLELFRGAEVSIIPKNRGSSRGYVQEVHLHQLESRRRDCDSARFSHSEDKGWGRSRWAAGGAAVYLHVAVIIIKLLQHLLHLSSGSRSMLEVKFCIAQLLLKHLIFIGILALDFFAVYQKVL